MINDELLFSAYKLREKLVTDKYRPRYHFLPPEGKWNDMNGLIYWRGRYHIGYLQKIGNGENKLDYSSWQHISSRDLLHWRYHRTSISEPFQEEKGDYFNSGGVIAGAETPTIITNMPRKGICIYQSYDDNLDNWVPHSSNPIIPIEKSPRGEKRFSSQFPECKIFDPSGWKDGDTFYVLMGNKNTRIGYEGDCTSLLKSKNLENWKYVGPFYQSDRKWTEEIEDCACSDFFPFGEKYMLLMHTHRPYGKCQYYIGTLEHETFIPEINGQLSWLGSMLAGPETLIDDKGRRIFWGWINDGRDWNDSGWTGVMTMPWHFYPDSQNNLKISPVQELKSLRYNEVKINDFCLVGEPGTIVERTINQFSSDCMEINLCLVPKEAQEFGFKLLCSPDDEEKTIFLYDKNSQQFTVDFRKASADKSIVYPQGTTTQIIPFKFTAAEMYFDIFVDRSVIEVFIDSKIVIVQRVYPTKQESRQFRVFTRQGSLTIKNGCKWDMDATNPW